MFIIASTLFFLHFPGITCNSIFFNSKSLYQCFLDISRSGKTSWCTHKSVSMSGWKCRLSGYTWSRSSPQKTSCSRCLRKDDSSRWWTGIGRMSWRTQTKIQGYQFFFLVSLVRVCVLSTKYIIEKNLIKCLYSLADFIFLEFHHNFSQ